jgi:endonuclease/exonuclease/phosphatase family metal-dependent hydrolase
MKLVTWNIQWGRGADGRVDLDRIVADARQLADFDVLCLQEVSDGYPELAGCDGSDQFAGLAQRLPGYAAFEGVATDTPRPGGGRRRFGNMILTRLPVRQAFRHLLPWPADAAVRSMQRGLLELTVEAAFGPLRVATTHLEYYSETQRAAQAERLRELHAEGWRQSQAAPPGDASQGPFEAVARGAGLVLVGDFNFRPEAPERTRITAPSDDPAVPALHDAWTLMHPGTPHETTVGRNDPVQWPGPAFTCDFVFVSDDLAPRLAALEVDDLSNGSDHQPVLLELRDAP